MVILFVFTYSLCTIFVIIYLNCVYYTHTHLCMNIFARIFYVVVCDDEYTS